MARRAACAVTIGVLFWLLVGSAVGQEIRRVGEPIQRVEVVQVEGLIDSSVERTIGSVIEDAEKSVEASLVVLQIDSPGVVGAGRARRIARRIGESDLPVIAWVGPARARAKHGAIVVLNAGMTAAAPGAVIGPLESLDLKNRFDPDVVPDYIGLGSEDLPERELLITSKADYPLVAIAPSIEELITEFPRPVLDRLRGEPIAVFDTRGASIRFHNLDLFGRLLHAAAQPSITYLLLLVGLVGVVFEVFHPSTGPAGIAGLAGLALAVYGVATLGGSWLGMGLIVLGVAGFCVDLRFQGLGPFTVGGFAGLVAGSLLLFPGPWLRVSPWVLAFGIVGMVLFLLGAMTRVLRDLRAVARGELEVTDAHPHPDERPG